MPNFSGWQEWALAAEHNIKTYTGLNQIGLSDNEMSAENYLENFHKINLTAPDGKVDLRLYLTTANYPNLLASVCQKFADDGIKLTHNGTGVLNIYKSNDPNSPTRIDYWFETTEREKRYECAMNRDGQEQTILYPFLEVAYIEKPLKAIELLNGWEKYKDDFVISKIGDYVNLTFAIDKGTRENGTVIFVLPEKFRPKSNRSCPILAMGAADTRSRVVFYSNGNAVLFECTNSTGYIVFSGGFTK